LSGNFMRLQGAIRGE